MRIPSIPGFNQQAFEKYLKNTGWLFIGRIGSLAIKWAIGLWITNYLGKGLNGVLTGSITYIYFFTAIATLGLDQFVVKEIHQFPDQKDQILGTSFIMKVGAGCLCIPLIYLAYLIYPAKGTPYSYVFILSFTGVIQAFNVIDSYFQSQVQSKYIMRVQVIGNVISAIIKAVLIILHQPLEIIVWSYLFDIIILSVGYFLVYQTPERNILDWDFNLSLAKKLLSYSWPLIIAAIMVSVYMKIDQIMLQNMRGVDEAGAYATVASLSENWNFIPLVIVSSLFPAILNARRDDPVRYQKRLQSLYDLMVYISLPVAVIISFTAPWIYKLYKHEYAYAAPVLSVHIWSGIFVFLGVASTQQLIAENLNRLTFIRTGFGAVVNVVLNLILIPRMGMMGAAISTLVAYASAPLFLLFIPQTYRQGVMMIKSLFLISLIQKIFNR